LYNIYIKVNFCFNLEGTKWHNFYKNWDWIKTKIKIQGSNWEWENDTCHYSDTWHYYCHMAWCQRDTWQIFNFFKNIKKI